MLQEEGRKTVEVEEEVIMPKGPKKFTARKLAEASATSWVMKMLEDTDNHRERFVNANRLKKDALVCYREIHHKTQKLGSQNLAFSLRIRYLLSQHVSLPLPSTGFP